MARRVRPERRIDRLRRTSLGGPFDGWRSFANRSNPSAFVRFENGHLMPYPMLETLPADRSNTNGKPQALPAVGASERPPRSAFADLVPSSPPFSLRHS